MKAVYFTVNGVATPQGSIKAVRRPDGSMWMKYPAKLKHWRSDVAREAALAMKGRAKLEGALQATLSFYLPEPKKPVRRRPSVRPDLDKLCRAIFDACESIVYTNDAQITALTAGKHYAPHGRVLVVIEEIPVGRR